MFFYIGYQEKEQRVTVGVKHKYFVFNINIVMTFVLQKRKKMATLEHELLETKATEDKKKKLKLVGLYRQIHQA